MPGGRTLSLDGDKGFGSADFVNAPRSMTRRPHVARLDGQFCVHGGDDSTFVAERH